MAVATIDTCPSVRPIVELGVGAIYDETGTAQWDVDLWDDAGSAFWVGDQPYWHDFACYVRDISTQAGRERAIDQWEVGSATITLDNSSGIFDFPIGLEGLTDESPLLSVRPGRSIRVRVAVDGGAPVTLWAGYVDAVNPQYDAVDGNRVVLECIDAKGDAGRSEVPSVAVAVGAGETVTERVVRILDAAGWPDYRRDIGTSGVQLVGTELGSKAVDLLNLAADSAGGTVFGDLGDDIVDPRVTYRNRDFPNYDNADLPAGNIGDLGLAGTAAHYEYVIPLLEGDGDGDGLYDPTGFVTVVETPPGSGLYVTTAPVDLVWTVTPEGIILEGGDVIPAIPADTCPSSWELSFARADITTKVLLARRDDDTERIYPTEDQLADEANGFRHGLSMFGVEPFKRDDLETLLDPDIDWLGERILTTRSWHFMPRVVAVTVTATDTHPETIGTLAAASPFTAARFRCYHRINDRTVFNRVMMVVGVAHTISPAGWDARISLDDAEPFLVGGAHPARWDDTDVALWSDDANQYATWADPT